MESSPKANRSYTRRQFLKGLPFGIAGAFAVTAVISKLIPTSRSPKKRITFSDDSIFAPDKNRYPKA